MIEELLDRHDPPRHAVNRLVHAADAAAADFATCDVASIDRALFAGRDAYNGGQHAPANCRASDIVTIIPGMSIDCDIEETGKPRVSRGVGATSGSPAVSAAHTAARQPEPVPV